VKQVWFCVKYDARDGPVCRSKSSGGGRQFISLGLSVTNDHHYRIGWSQKRQHSRIKSRDTQVDYHRWEVPQHRLEILHHQVAHDVIAL
jgi:hypothetical protein